jgi:hypothetical protein
VVANRDYAYVLDLVMADAGHATCGARVDYTVP